MKPFSRLISTSGILICIVSAAFLLRLFGLNFGLPYIYHQDEPILVNHAMAIGVGGWNPKFFIIPPFPIYSLFLLFGAYFVAGIGFGIFQNSMDFALSFLKDPTAFYLLGRFVLGVLFGTATVWLVARWGKRVFSEKIGLVGALFLAVSLIHVQHSHYIYADTALTFALTLFLYLLFSLQKKPTLKNYVLAGIVFGWAVSIKYTAAYLLPVLLVAPLLGVKSQDKGIRIGVNYLAMGAASLITFAAIAPYTFLDWTHFYDQISTQKGVQYFVGWWHHFSYSILQGTSPFLVLFAFFGLIFMLRGKQKAGAFILGLTLVIYYGVNTVFGQPFARYMLPLIPALCLLAAVGVIRCLEGLKWEGKIQGLVIGVIALSLIIPSLYSDYLFIQKDTRTQAKEWIEENIPAGSAFAFENRFYAPRLAPAPQQIKKKFGLLEESDLANIKRKRLEMMLEAVKGEKTYLTYKLSPLGENVETKFLFEHPFAPLDRKGLRDMNIQYLIFNPSEPDKQIHHFKESLDPHLELVAEFSPYYSSDERLMKDRYGSTAAPHNLWELFSRNRLGPYLEIYKVKT